MNAQAAQHFLQDIRPNIEPTDYATGIYLSIRGVGTKTFHNATHQIVEGWLFIWTEDDSFCIRLKDLGDFILADTSDMPIFNLRANS